MRSILSVLGALFCAGATALAQEAATPTALAAVKLLPKTETKRLARIEAREGKPTPDRWHILVHDPKESTGVHEYVIAGDEVVASRSVSQFAESLKEADVIGADGVKIDSDKVSKLAQQYAFANNITVAAMNYELMREGDGAAPLWKVTCLDETGRTVGSVVMTASKGTVVSHDGFPLAPVTTQEKLTVQADTGVGESDPGTPSATEPAADEVAPTDAAATAAATGAAGAVAGKATPAATPKKKTTTRTRSRRSDGDNDDDGRPSFFRRAGGKLQRFFTGKDTISR